MNAKEKLFLIGGVVTGIALTYLTGCVTPAGAGSSYPQYDKWWKEGEMNTRSQSRVVDPMPVNPPKLVDDFPGPFPMPEDRPREWDQKWDLTPEELRIGPPVSVGYGTADRVSFPVEAHTDDFGVVTYTQLL